MPTNADIITRVRTRGGITADGPSALSDAEITSLIDDARAVLSTHLPKRALSYVTSVANQQNYVLEESTAPDYVYKIFDTSTSSGQADDPFALEQWWSSYGGIDPSGDPSSSIYLNPSLYYISLQQLANMRNVIGRASIYNRATRTLSILPVPKTVTRYYYAAGYTWPIAELPAHYVPILADLVIGEAILAVAAKLSRQAGASTSGAVGIYGNLSNYMKMGEDKKREAIAEAKKMASIEGPTLG